MKVEGKIVVVMGGVFGIGVVIVWFLIVWNCIVVIVDYEEEKVV